MGVLGTEAASHRSAEIFLVEDKEQEHQEQWFRIISSLRSVELMSIIESLKLWQETCVQATASDQIIIDLCDLFLEGKETPEELTKIKERIDALDNEC
jgi:hypothetical protein